MNCEFKFKGVSSSLRAKVNPHSPKHHPLDGLCDSVVDENQLVSH
jgi:hypothetical protein